MCAEQGSSEEYKSQLGYPNTSKTILHISANTFGAGGPGQRQHSHTCTHTRVYTCTHHTHASAPSPFGFLLLLVVVLLHLPCASSASEAFFLVHWQNQQQKEAAKSSIGSKRSQAPVKPRETNSRKQREPAAERRQLSAGLAKHQYPGYPEGTKRRREAILWLGCASKGWSWFPVLAG